jgi:hypothetical protein
VTEYKGRNIASQGVEKNQQYVLKILQCMAIEL